MTVCESRDGDVQCERTDTMQYTVGCIHEHVRQAWICPWHRDLIDQGINFCRICDRHSQEPHGCQLVARP